MHKYFHVQCCAKVMQTNFDEIPGFSKKFHLKQYFKEISPHFCDAYSSGLHEFSNDNSLDVITCPAFLSDNSLLLKILSDFSNDNLFLKMRCKLSSSLCGKRFREVQEQRIIA